MTASTTWRRWLAAVAICMQFAPFHSFQTLFRGSAELHRATTLATERAILLSAEDPTKDPAMNADPPSKTSGSIVVPIKALKPGQSRRWETLPREGIEKRAVAWTQNNRLVATTYDWNGALYLCARAEMHDAVLSLYRQMRVNTAVADPDADTFGHVLASAAKSGQWRVALDIAEKDMEQEYGLDPNLKTWTAILHAASRDKSKASARRALESFEAFSFRQQRKLDSKQLEGLGDAVVATEDEDEDEVRDDTSGAIQTRKLEQQQQRQWPSAVALDAPAFNTLIGLRAQLGDMPGAMALFWQMETQVAAASLASPPLPTLSPIAELPASSPTQPEGEECSGRPRRVADPFFTGPTVRTYTTLMASMKRERDFTGILRLFAHLTTERRKRDLEQQQQHASSDGGDGDSPQPPRRPGLHPDAHVYGLVLMAQCKLGRWDDALNTHDRMWRKGSVGVGVDDGDGGGGDDDDATDGVGGLLLGGGSVGSASASERVRPNEVTYALAIGAAARKGDLPKALSLLVEMRQEHGLDPGVRAYTAALGACRAGGDWRQAKALVDEFREQERRRIHALGVFEGTHRRRSEPAVSTAAAAAAGLVGGEDSSADDGADHGDDANEHGSGLNVISYTAAISTCVAQAEVGWAYQLMGEMRAEGVRPNRYTYNCLLRVCAEAAATSAASATAGEAGGWAGRRVGEGSGGEKQAAAEGKRASDVEAQVAPGGGGGVHRQHPNRGVALMLGAYAEMLSDAATAIDGPPKQEGASFGGGGAPGGEEEKRNGRPISPDSYTYGALLTGCQRAGDSGLALSILRGMSDPGGFPAPTATLASPPSSIGDGEAAGQGEAKQNQRRSKRFGVVSPREEHLTAALGACVKAKDGGTALAMLRVLEDNAPAAPAAAAAADDDDDDDASQSESVRGGEGASVGQQQQQQGRGGVTVTTGSAIMALLAVAADPQSFSRSTAARTTAEDCYELLSRHRQQPEGAPAEMSGNSGGSGSSGGGSGNGFPGQVMFTSRVYGLLVDVLSRSGSIDLALQVLQEAEEKSFRPDEATYVELIAACERSGRWRRALALLEDMRRRRYNFYSNSFLDALFKRLVQAWSAASKTESDLQAYLDVGSVGEAEVASPSLGGSGSSGVGDSDASLGSRLGINLDIAATNPQMDNALDQKSDDGDVQEKRADNTRD